VEDSTQFPLRTACAPEPSMAAVVGCEQAIHQDAECRLPSNHFCCTHKPTYATHLVACSPATQVEAAARMVLCPLLIVVLILVTVVPLASCAQVSDCSNDTMCRQAGPIRSNVSILTWLAYSCWQQHFQPWLFHAATLDQQAAVIPLTCPACWWLAFAPVVSAPITALQHQTG
jgi:hypothetical protein